MSELTLPEADLIAGALEARRWAYAPYSHYAVGAAVGTASGKIYTGANIENAAYPVGLCAERVAAAKAVSEGEREFLAVAVATANAGAPCGACRQFLAEFGLPAVVLIVDGQGQVRHRLTVADLLPLAFGPRHLT